MTNQWKKPVFQQPKVEKKILTLQVVEDYYKTDRASAYNRLLDLIESGRLGNDTIGYYDFQDETRPKGFRDAQIIHCQDGDIRIKFSTQSLHFYYHGTNQDNGRRTDGEHSEDVQEG